MVLRGVSVAMVLSMLTLAFSPVGGAANADGDAEVVVAVLDSGIRATHDEFDYKDAGGTGDGPAGQLVGWWDFTDEAGAVEFPGSGDTWDDRFAPYDNDGHGTAVASLVGGETVSLAPGTKIAMAKVMEGDGSISNMGAAYDWALNTIEADVISISIGTIVPWPGLFESLDETFEEARARGVLTVVAAGNGWGVGCAPAWTWASGYGFEASALSVGRLFESGGANAFVSCTHLDPDIAGSGYDVPAAEHTHDSAIGGHGGTSFAAPLVAGGAAELMAELASNGHADTPEAVEELLFSCATDHGWPYAIQGNGFYHTTEHAFALDAAADGTVCNRPSFLGINREVNHAYGDTVADTGKFLFTEGADLDHAWSLEDTGQDPGTPADVIGASQPTGSAEAELYEITLAQGQTSTIEIAYGPNPAGMNDFDVALFRPGASDDGSMDLFEREGWAAEGADVDESLVFTAPYSGTFELAIYGWLVLDDQPITVTASGDGAGTLTFQGQTTVVGQRTIS